MKAHIEFKAKPESVWFMGDDSPSYDRIKVPAISTRHCDMSYFRTKSKLAPYSNSDMFAGMINRALRNQGIGNYIRLDKPLPHGVTVDTSGFLARVFINIEE